MFTFAPRSGPPPPVQPAHPPHLTSLTTVPAPPPRPAPPRPHNPTPSDTAAAQITMKAQKKRLHQDAARSKSNYSLSDCLK